MSRVPFSILSLMSSAVPLNNSKGYHWVFKTEICYKLPDKLRILVFAAAYGNLPLKLFVYIAQVFFCLFGK